MSVPTVDPTDTLAVLKAAEEWLGDSAHWTQYVYWRRDDGDEAGCREEVHCTCLLGALSYVSGREADYQLPKGAEDVIYDVFDGTPLSANDERGYEAVMAGLRKAIEKLEAGQR